MISLGLIFLAITIIGFFGNVLVILVIFVNRQLHDSTNILICNLAVADLLFLTFCVPITAYSYIYMWNFSESICYITVTLQYVTCYVSVWTLVLLAYDRYVSIVCPTSSMNMRRGHSVFYVCLTLWLLIFGLNFSQMQGVGVLSFHFNGTVGMACVDSLSIATETSTPLNARMFYWGFNFCAYVLPLTLSSLFYFLLVRSIWKQKMVQSKSSEKMKKHATKMVFIVIITFSFCWFPQNLRFFLRGLSYPEMTFWEEHAPDLLLYVQSTIQVLAYANSCVNPILYGVLSERFRVGVNVAWHRFVCCNPHADRQYCKKRSTLIKTTRCTSTNQTRTFQLSQPTYPEFSSKNNGLAFDSNSKLNYKSRMSFSSTCHAEEFLPVTPKCSIRSTSRSPSPAPPTSISFNYTEGNKNFGSDSNCSVFSKMPAIFVGDYDFQDSDVVLL